MVIDKIRKYLKEDLKFSFQGEISDSAPLIESGMIDSFSAVKLMMFIEEEFNIKIEAEDLTKENIFTLKNIEALILRKQKK
jgi:acyl carrier protein